MASDSCLSDHTTTPQGKTYSCDSCEYDESVRDVWTANIQGGVVWYLVVLGCSPGMTCAIRRVIIYTCTHAGVVQRIGTHTTRSNSVTNLEIVSDRRLLMSHIGGSRALFDLRSSVKRVPVMQCLLQTTQRLHHKDREWLLTLMRNFSSQLTRTTVFAYGLFILLALPASVFRKSFDPVLALKDREGSMALWASSGLTSTT
ncbi:hypothetical protein M405DRAFT_838931 [Rhizopogon salebrosus TDB-379]|nr:hypothetical protein M405DRAFT_838931 [Rhizopogon salebrosus TDB-379]